MAPIANPLEMALPIETAVSRLNADVDVVVFFKRQFTAQTEQVYTLTQVAPTTSTPSPWVIRAVRTGIGLSRLRAFF